MILTQKNGLSFWQSENLLKLGVPHGSFTRQGGVSKPPFDSLNVSFELGDQTEDVIQNRKKIMDTLLLTKLIDAKQVHGDECFIYKNEMPTPCDGLVTREVKVGLLIKHADCQAAIFYDPTKKVIAAVHAGWKGNVKRIYTKMVEKLIHEFDVNPKDLYVMISPSLGPKEAEFINYRQEFPEDFFPFQETPFHFNLWDIAEKELLSAGIPLAQIEIAKVSTAGDLKNYFSFRKEGVTGRLATVIALT